MSQSFLCEGFQRLLLSVGTEPVWAANTGLLAMFHLSGCGSEHCKPLKPYQAVKLPSLNGGDLIWLIRHVHSFPGIKSTHSAIINIEPYNIDPLKTLPPQNRTGLFQVPSETSTSAGRCPLTPRAASGDPHPLSSDTSDHRFGSPSLSEGRG